MSRSVSARLSIIGSVARTKHRNAAATSTTIRDQLCFSVQSISQVFDDRCTLARCKGMKVPSANIAINDKPLKTTFFALHFTRRVCPCIFNHFYVIGPKSYRVRRNNANYTAITPFKVLGGHRFCYQSKAHMQLPISD